MLRAQAQFLQLVKSSTKFNLVCSVWLECFCLLTPMLLFFESLTTYHVFLTTYHLLLLSFQVVERLLSIPASYWSRYAYPDDLGMEHTHHVDTPDHKGKLLKGTLL